MSTCTRQQPGADRYDDRVDDKKSEQEDLIRVWNVSEKPSRSATVNSSHPSVFPQNGFKRKDAKKREDTTRYLCETSRAFASLRLIRGL
jgi:hypothetical protein